MIASVHGRVAAVSAERDALTSELEQAREAAEVAQQQVAAVSAEHHAERDVGLGEETHAFGGLQPVLLDRRVDLILQFILNRNVVERRRLLVEEHPVAAHADGSYWFTDPPFDRGALQQSEKPPSGGFFVVCRV